MRTRLVTLTSVATLAVAAQAFAGATTLGPTPYLSFSDSPFAPLTFQQFHLENLEDGSLNTLGLSASTGTVLAPGALTDSVDGDDGAIDGLGTAGHSWFSNFATNSIVFTFDPLALGGLPTHVGIVWTDVGITDDAIGVADVIFEVFGPGGVSIATVGPDFLGDGSSSGQTAEDRFYGAIDLDGIEAISITIPSSTDWEVDHIQYGIIPEPLTALLLVAGALALRRNR